MYPFRVKPNNVGWEKRTICTVKMIHCNSTVPWWGNLKPAIITGHWLTLIILMLTNIFSVVWSRLKTNVMWSWGWTRDTHCSDSVPLRNHWGKRTRRSPAEGCSGRRCGKAPGNTGGPGTWLRWWSAWHSPLWGWGYPSEWSGSRKHKVKRTLQRFTYFRLHTKGQPTGRI